MNPAVTCDKSSQRSSVVAASLSPLVAQHDHDIDPRAKMQHLMFGEIDQDGVALRRPRLRIRRVMLRSPF